jgi:PAS domain S-box-containing protein
MSPSREHVGVDLLRAVLDQSPAAMIVTDASGVVLLVNQEAEYLLARAPASLDGVAVDSLLPERLRGERALRPGPSGRDEVSLPAVRGDGVEIALQWRVQRVQGGTYLTYVIAPTPGADASDERFEAAVESAPSAMIMIDRDGVIQLVNRETERLFGGTREQLVGMSLDKLVPERMRRGHAEMRAGYFEAPSMRRMGIGRELFARRMDGTEIPVEIALNPIRAGGQTFVLASIVDISARREAERAQREREERDRQRQKLESVGTLAGGIAHDFNNVLGGIVGYTELVQRALPEGDPSQADLQQVLRAADRGRQLVQRILTFSRQRDAARHPMPLDHTVHEVLDLLRATLPSTIELRCTIDPRTPAILCDETELHQVLLNLATNAGHAMEKGGKLEVEVAPYAVDARFAARHDGLRPGPHARLTVIDNGHGMSPEVRERVFEPFFTTKPVGKGSGLGLSVIHGIVQSLGGAIELWSEPGVGTRIDLLFPAVVEVAEGAAVAAAGAPAAGGRHVLLVEDEPALASMEKRQLESLGYRVTVHTSSVQALEAFRAAPATFDLVVTDNNMPRMTGLQLAQALLAMRPDLPILMVSGIAETADADRLSEIGVRGVLAKPHTAKALHQALEQLFEGR